MEHKLSPPAGGKTVLLFGCQCLSFDANDFRRLRSIVLDSDEHSWVVHVLAELPVYYRTASKLVPQLGSIPAEKQLQDLHQWFCSGEVKEDYFPIPYVQLAPLFMVLQFTQYAQYLHLTHPEYVSTGKIHSADSPVVEIAGFCIGFLGAVVAAAAANREQFQEYAKVAVRLSMLLGAMGDAQEVDERYTSLAMVWKAPEAEEQVSVVLEQFPGAYITVHYDNNRSTLMCPRHCIGQLQRALHDVGVNSSPVAFNGRYHWSGHERAVHALQSMCDTAVGLQLPDPSQLIKPVRDNVSGDVVTKGPLHHRVLQSILAQKCQWFYTFYTLHAANLTSPDSILVEFGTERCVPPSFIRTMRSRVVHYTDLELDLHSRLSPLHTTPPVYDDDVAVVGMACRVAGADDLDEFWQLLCSGESQHKEMPAERYENYETPWRPDAIRGWFGNFMRDIDAFDHRFFKKVPREVMSQDPQQRLLLQVAYQALEQAGYFQRADPDRNIGCYVTCCTVDYEHNVNCHTASAYAATGLLRSFIAGKMSHYFGWRGPSLCVDTACSGSAVALHQACRAILSGECSAALVGGANILTSPLAFDNLNGASFVSPTGPCKPFDAKADGYCRGEGVAAVFVKKMSDALADGDTILGTIAATAVDQNNNCTPIVVPDAASLAGLFTKVTRRARLLPKDISVVEAHGTGTQAGDPAEYSSVRQVLGGPQRETSLALGSVKGLVGHTEGVSGLVALVKVLLMIHEDQIPPQANFHSMNPHIETSPDDHINIPKQTTPWNAKFRAALINNYGASGSNASMIITQAPCSKEKHKSCIHRGDVSIPFRLCGSDESRLRDSAERLRRFLRRQALSASASIADVAFAACRQANPALDCHLLLRCRSVAELDQKLTAVVEGGNNGIVQKKPTRPVVLCFGGQVSTSVGLDRSIYDALHLLRSQLDECDRILRSLDHPGLYPGIFEQRPIADQVDLQTKLFALQYSYARCWIDSGVPVTAVVGHSFGELTALCVSGVLSLPDALDLVARRAALIRHSWGADSGAMLAVEGDRTEIDQLLATTNRGITDAFPATIACLNGPRSFTLAGPARVIDAMQQILNRPSFKHMRTRRLSVTNAFHSTLVDPLIPELERVTDGLTLREPTIHLERATEHPATGIPPSTVVADHLRQPVYFEDAIHRLAEKHPSAVWLEAGSNSTVTLMAARALASVGDNHHFQAVNFTSGTGLQGLTDATISLWTEGISATFWGYHPCQTGEYTPVLLPPYQFEKSRHWMHNKKLPVQATGVSTESAPLKASIVVTFTGYQDKNERIAKFTINTSHPDYHDALTGHVAAQTAPLAPASMMLDNVIEALRTLPECTDKVPIVRTVTSEAPLCPDPSRTVWIELHAQDGEKQAWNVRYLSENSDKGSRTQVLHCNAQVSMLRPDDPDLLAEFARYTRLFPHRRCKQVLNDPDVDDILQGRAVYKGFSEVVEYSDLYKGVYKIVGKGTESAGRVVKQYTGKTWADPFLCDSFSQVAGFWVNCMTDRPESDIFIAAGMEQWMRSPRLADPHTPRPERWDVFATHVPGENIYTSDIFAFDAETGELVEVFLGMQYTRVAKKAFRKLLGMFAPGYGATSAVDNSDEVPHAVQRRDHRKETTQKEIKTPDLGAKVKAIVAEFCAVDPKEIHDSNSMADSGIDSLMAMELARELDESFHCSIPATDLMEADTFRDLVNCVRTALGEDEPEEEGPLSSSESDGEIDMGASAADSVTTVSCDESELYLPPQTVLDAFGETKKLTDDFLANNQCSGRVHIFNPVQIQLCVTLTLEAFETLGSSIRTANPGQRLSRIAFDPQHRELVDYLYLRLEEARIVDLDGPAVIRTAVSAPPKSSAALMQNIERAYPEFAGASRLSFYTGSHLANVLRGDQDGLQLIFGTKEGQDLVSWMYGDEPHNVAGYKQILDFIQRVASKLDSSDNTGPLKILEMGAGTGGGTKYFLPSLAKLGVPVEYTFTDISPAFLAQARRRFKEYPFVKYRVHDIEKGPAEELLGTQHIVIASNAVHATSNLQDSTGFMRQVLRHDGVVLMLEMTQPVFAIDIVFGLFRGWWVFRDGRTHAITSERRWEADLHAAGYGHVDWTDGHSPEVNVQRVLFAMASGKQRDKLPVSIAQAVGPLAGVDNVLRDRLTSGYVRAGVDGLTFDSIAFPRNANEAITVLVTGGTGSLGSHLVAHLARMPSVHQVVCLNRRTTISDATERQKQALIEKKLSLSPTEMAKLCVIETNTADAHLGLPRDRYEGLTATVTHIIHNAWPMNGARALSSFEPQFSVMRQLLILAKDICCQGVKPTFQLVSSISTVGYYPLLTGQAIVPERPTQIAHVLNNGYGEAKLVCERMLYGTLLQYPDRFSAMVVRPGQISGSSSTGYWNDGEHLPALIKSAETLRALPDLRGPLSWTPVDAVATSLVDLLFVEYPRAVYHIDNPVRQPWEAMIPILAKGLAIPVQNVVPFAEWIQRVKNFPGSREDNPAGVMADWLEANFERMSCGGLLLDTAQGVEHSPALKDVGPVGEEVVRKYLDSWIQRGFLAGPY
ncbi:polyketide synthase [Aspergillus campestris IBT 28561]|uniref:Polyketide synthase n=1 Tax=Aspergillus campestris (strain IBT 28561) TaxID=1392248 RepID=A0A2I1CS61_ASPC2|nr:polyketide synthase [Aspergillus campestris IBT 28561]PKY00457.1 polyketide synthase [Aspergillus campestris IBT 28561]